MTIDHETIETYFDLLRNADANGRIAVVMKDFDRATGYSRSQLEEMTPEAKCWLLYDAVFSRFVVSLHKLSPFSTGNGFRALGATLDTNNGTARIEFNLARAFGLPGVEAAAELAELSEFLKYWVALYKRHATLHGGSIRIWSAGSPLSIDWNSGSSSLPQESKAAISKDLANRIAASKTLTAWLRNIRQVLCLTGQYSHYSCSPHDILTEDECFGLPESSPLEEV
ncbi:MAG: hypothetical protein OEL20_04635 [Sulfuritalea sp.]|nr:hypothetical protein [Sulfuritalea sp.]